MAKELMTIRVHPTLLERADGLKEYVADVQKVTEDEISRSEILRVALQLGIEMLEKRDKARK